MKWPENRIRFIPSWMITESGWNSPRGDKWKPRTLDERIKEQLEGLE